MRKLNTSKVFQKHLNNYAKSALFNLLLGGGALGFGVSKIWDAATSYSKMEHQALLGEVKLPDELIEDYEQKTQKQ